MEPIRIVAVGDFRRPPPDRVALRLEQLLHTQVFVSAAALDATGAYDPARQQYRSDLLLDDLAARAAPGEKILGITDADLFIPVLTFVFGEAQLDGRAAIVSSFRLRSELYGLAPDPALLEARVVKEAMHELGHTFGLVHCYTPGCVMQPSTYAELVDLKEEIFCERCTDLLGPAGPERGA